MMVKANRIFIILISFTLFFSFLLYLPVINGSKKDINKAVSTDRWALVVGISDYPGSMNDLNFCDNDAHEMKDWLMNNNFPEENIRILIDSQVTGNNFQTEINWITNNCDGNDDFFFFYSGHGDKSGSTTSIVPYDYTNGDITEGQLDNYFDQINCSRMILLFDSCYSGGLIDSLTGSNRIIITACDVDESSAESILLKQGIFTYFFLKSYENLNADYNSDKKVTIEEAFTYTHNYSLNYGISHSGNTQTAQIYDNIPNDLFLSPYFDITYSPEYYGSANIVIIINPIGFDEIINVSVIIMLNEIEYQIISSQNINLTREISFNLLYGNYEFRLSTIYSNGTYYGRFYSIYVMSFFQSYPGLFMVILGIVSLIGLTTAIVIIYKKMSYFKLDSKELISKENYK